MYGVESDTPWEYYDVSGFEVAVKREDLCCPHGPGFSKMRGVAEYLSRVKRESGPVPIGVLDTVHSKAGQGVAWLCRQMGLPCIDFYPVYKRELTDVGHELRSNQRIAEVMGAKLFPLEAGMSAVLYYKASKILRQITGGKGVMLPNGLKLRETVRATSEELINYTPKDLMCGTWVVSISTGTIAAGVIKGLWNSLCRGWVVVAHMGYGRSANGARRYISQMAGLTIDDLHGHLSLINEEYEYKDSVDNSWIPFPCNPYYDAKAFTWLVDHIDNLEPPVVFWNIGD